MLNLNPTAVNVLKGLGVAGATAAAGFGAYKAYEHFSGKGQEEPATDQATLPEGSPVTDESGPNPDFQELSAIQLDSYPDFIANSFPNLQIREGTAFDYQGSSYILIEGNDTKMETGRPQAILFMLDGGAYRMVSSVTVLNDTVSYNHRDSNVKVYIGTKQQDTVKAFTGSGTNEPLSNFENDFVVAL
ncbi:MAG: hypothetical protein ACRCXZ_02065 [Patescibacteria group bacterium]